MERTMGNVAHLVFGGKGSCGKSNMARALAFYHRSMIEETKASTVLVDTDPTASLTRAYALRDKNGDVAEIQRAYTGVLIENLNDPKDGPRIFANALGKSDATAFVFDTPSNGARKIAEGYGNDATQFVQDWHSEDFRIVVHAMVCNDVASATGVMEAWEYVGKQEHVDFVVWRNPYDAEFQDGFLTSFDSPTDAHPVSNRNFDRTYGTEWCRDKGIRVLTMPHKDGIAASRESSVVGGTPYALATLNATDVNGMDRAAKRGLVKWYAAMIPMIDRLMFDLGIRRAEAPLTESSVLDAFRENGWKSR